jgi:hypothetical protein
VTIQQLDQYGSGVGCSILIAVSPIILMIIASLFRIEVYNFVELIFLGISSTFKSHQGMMCNISVFTISKKIGPKLKMAPKMMGYK